MANTLEARLGKALNEKGLTLAVGESCTGGLLSHLITNVAGASAYFRGGVVAYAYEAKERQLGVRHATLYEHGAVSQQTALEMARGARHSFSADIGVAVTGIAGPSGGLPNKPVGLTWVAVSTRFGESAHKHLWEGDRAFNKKRSAEAALDLLLQTLEQIP